MIGKIGKPGDARVLWIDVIAQKADPAWLSSAPFNGAPLLSWAVLATAIGSLDQTWSCNRPVAGRAAWCRHFYLKDL